MDKEIRSQRAYNLLRDETFMTALEDVKAQINKELLGASTDEECVELWREHRAMTRIERKLTKWSQGAKPKT